MENLLSFIKNISSFISPLLVTLTTIIIFSIVSFTQDRFLKINVKDKNSAVNKIILALYAIFISILLQFIFISQATINLKTYLKDDNNFHFFLTTCTLMTFLFSFVMLFIKLAININSKPHYYLTNEDNKDLNISFKKLILLQKYEDTYICTFDEPTNSERVIIRSDDLINRKICYSSDFDLISELKIYNKLKEKFKRTAWFVFISIVVFLIAATVGITGVLFTISEIPFYKSTSLDIFIFSLFIIMIAIIIWFTIINFRTKKSPK